MRRHGPSSRRTESDKTLIHARGLGIRFGAQWALAHVDLDVASGDRLLLAGANGSGKTTLLRLIAGLRQPTAGDLHVDGRRPTRERLGARSVLALVSHHDYLYDRLTAMETLRLWKSLSRSTRQTSRQRSDGSSETRLDDLLAEVGLSAAADRPVGGFSAGMRKRLILARSRMENPRLLLLDEPFASLDPDGQSLVERWIGRFVDGGGTLIVASHAIERASRLCNRAVLLEQGQVAWQGDASGLEAAWGRRPGR